MPVFNRSQYDFILEVMKCWWWNGLEMRLPIIDICAYSSAAGTSIMISLMYHNITSKHTDTGMLVQTEW